MDEFVLPIEPSRPVANRDKLNIVYPYLDEATCKKLVSFADWCQTSKAPIAEFDTEGNLKSSQSAQFTADRIEVYSFPYMRNQCAAIINDVYKNHVNKFYKVDIEWFEFPHILRYGPGGNYRPHVDAEKWDQQNKQWKKVLDRDFSTIIYLGSNFSGGSLTFPQLNLRIIPRAGMLVTFPSDHRFLHTAEPVIKGTRYALVTWGAIRGEDRVMKIPVEQIVRIY